MPQVRHILWRSIKPWPAITIWRLSWQWFSTWTLTLTSQKLIVFTARRYASRGLTYRNSVCLSVCSSVSLSVTVRPTITISSPHGSPIILVSGDITFIPKFEGGYPQARALNEGGVGTNWWFSTNKSPYLRYTYSFKKVDKRNLNRESYIDMHTVNYLGLVQIQIHIYSSGHME